MTVMSRATGQELPCPCGFPGPAASFTHGRAGQLVWWLGACDLGWIPDLTFTNCNNRTYFTRLLSRTELIYVRCLENSAWHITSTNYYYHHHHHCCYYYDSCYNDDDGDNEGGDDSGVGVIVMMMAVAVGNSFPPLFS